MRPVGVVVDRFRETAETGFFFCQLLHDRESTSRSERTADPVSTLRGHRPFEADPEFCAVQDHPTCPLRLSLEKCARNRQLSAPNLLKIDRQR